MCSIMGFTRAIPEADSLANHPEILGDCAVIPAETP